MAKQTYDVRVESVASRNLKVRASSPAEAASIASQRVFGDGWSLQYGPWFIDCPGGEDEHFHVSLDNVSLSILEGSTWCDNCGEKFTFDSNEHLGGREFCDDCTDDAEEEEEE